MTSLFRCPICGAPLTREERGYLCPARHSYDLSKEGYTHLLPANRKHSKNPGDDNDHCADGEYSELRKRKPKREKRTERKSADSGVKECLLQHGECRSCSVTTNALKP